jgi:hypothetical protein
VTLVEDHAYPKPGWPEALLAAHKGRWAAVGSVVMSIRHANPSLLSSTLTLRFNGGRISGATRARLEHWSLPRRMSYAMCAPASRSARAPSSRKTAVGGVGSLGVSIHCDGVDAGWIGHAIGFLLGAGDTAQKLADFDVDRLRHVAPPDRRLLEQ